MPLSLINLMVFCFIVVDMPPRRQATATRSERVAPGRRITAERIDELEARMDHRIQTLVDTIQNMANVMGARGGVNPGANFEAQGGVEV